MADLIPDAELLAALARHFPHDSPAERAGAAARIGAALDAFCSRLRLTSSVPSASMLALALEQALLAHAMGPVVAVPVGISADHSRVLRTAEALLLEVRRREPQLTVDEALAHVSGWLGEQGVADADGLATEALMALMKRLSAWEPLAVDTLDDEER